MHIAIVSLLPDGQDATALKELHRINKTTSVPPHQLTDDPEQAELIIFTDLDRTRHYQSLRRHPWVRAYFQKCFTVYHWHEPHGFLPGIYTEVPEGAARWPSALYRAGLYWPAHHTNQIVREHGAELARLHATKVAPQFVFSFMGRNCYPVRSQLMRLPSNYAGRRAHLEITDSYDHWHQDQSAGGPQQRYVNIALDSAFVICPRGIRKPTIRLFEMMQLGICPVVMSDGYQFPDGPDWEKFCIILSESDAPRLWEILLAREDEAAERGRLARIAWETWFAPERQFDYIVDVLEDIRSFRHPEKEKRSIRWRWPLRIAQVEASQKRLRFIEKLHAHRERRTHAEHKAAA